MKQTMVVVGMQWGDEGKGKITNYLSDKYDFNIRYQGGDNAGHTIIINNKKYSLRHIPSGIFNPKVKTVLAQGMVINLKSLINELNILKKQNIKNFNLYISNRAHIILPYHIEIDKMYEKIRKKYNIGTTHNGIGPSYEDKYNRFGIRIGDFLNKKIFYKKLKLNINYKNKIFKAFNINTYNFKKIFDEYCKYAKIIKKHVVDTGELIRRAYNKKENLLFEGAQGLMLCIENGTYPYVTSSSPAPTSIPLNVGLPVNTINDVLGIVKAYTTRVGSGAFPTEINNKKINNFIREVGHEYGTVTNRARRIGWIDTVILNYGKKISGVNIIAITLLDVLDQLDEIKIGYAYTKNNKIINYIPSTIEEWNLIKVKYLIMPGWKQSTNAAKKWSDLPKNAQNYLTKIAELLKVKIKYVSVGPQKHQTFQLS